jgi:SAM-dependent methyltransferase
MPVCYSAAVDDWTKDFFTTAALDAWRRAHPPEVTQAEVDFITQVLELDDEPRHLLDVPCGDGRHARELAKLGHKITAIDRSPDNQAAVGKSKRIDFVLGDMRELAALPKKQAGFDGGYCWGNSFGYFPYAEMASFCASVAQRLQPGARFVIDTATCAETLLVELNRRSWQRVDDDMLLLMECEYDARESRLDTTYMTLLNDRVVDSRTAHHYVFTSKQILDMLEAAGFEAFGLYGDLEGAPFELGSERLLIVAQR